MPGLDYIAHHPSTGGSELELTAAVLALTQFYLPALVLAGWLLTRGRPRPSPAFEDGTASSETSAPAQTWAQQTWMLGTCVVGIFVAGFVDYQLTRVDAVWQGELALLGLLVVASTMAVLRREPRIKSALLTGIVAAVLFLAIFRNSTTFNVLEPAPAHVVAISAYLLICLGPASLRLQLVRLLSLAVCMAGVLVANSWIPADDPWLIRTAVVAPAACLLLVALFARLGTSVRAEPGQRRASVGQSSTVGHAV
jgi:hypothetical protein